MRIGLLTDIHEEVGHLRTALAVLKAEGADAIVQIGDACDRVIRVDGGRAHPE